MNRFKKSFILMGMLFPFFSIAQGNYTLKGSLAKQNISGKVYLNYVNGEEQIRDSADIKKGNFVIRGKVLQPVKAWMEVKYKEPGSKFIKEEREIYLDNERFSLKAEGSLKNATIENSAINAEWEKYNNVSNESEVDLNKATAEFRKASKEEEADTAFINRRKFKINAANKLRESILGNYVLQNPDSYFSLIALDQIAGPYLEAEKIVSLFKKLSPQLQNSRQGKALKSSIDRALTTSIGKVAPGFTRKNINNEEVSLSQYRGKYVLLDFWASWCAPCRAENPNVLKAYNQYQSKNFTVLGLSVDREVDRDKWIKAVEEDKLPWTQIIDEADGNSTADLYSIKSIPSNLLINPEGVIIGKNLRDTQLHKILAELFDK